MSHESLSCLSHSDRLMAGVSCIFVRICALPRHDCSTWLSVLDSPVEGTAASGGWWQAQSNPSNLGPRRHCKRHQDTRDRWRPQDMIKLRFLKSCAYRVNKSTTVETLISSQYRLFAENSAAVTTSRILASKKLSRWWIATGVFWVVKFMDAEEVASESDGHLLRDPEDTGNFNVQFYGKIYF